MDDVFICFNRTDGFTVTKLKRTIYNIMYSFLTISLHPCPVPADARGASSDYDELARPNYFVRTDNKIILLLF